MRGTQGLEKPEFIDSSEIRMTGKKLMVRTFYPVISALNAKQMQMRHFRIKNQKILKKRINALA